MRFVSWNILAGGGTRCRNIVRRLRRYDADILVLQETISTRAGDVCHVLAAAGYTYGFSAPRGPRDRGLCLLSRLPIRRVAEPPPPHAGIYPRGWLEVELEGSGTRVAAVYGPAAGPALPAYWSAAADWLACRARRPFVMLGDFNMGASLVDAPEYRFKAGRSFARLAELGLVDLWRRERKSRREYTWFSTPGGGRTPRGFRIDHAFASPVLADGLIACRYDHRVRMRGWSDHSLLVVDLSLPN
jgi:exodeoxyribonuclease III